MTLLTNTLISTNEDSLVTNAFGLVSFNEKRNSIRQLAREILIQLGVSLSSTYILNIDSMQRLYKVPFLFQS